MRCILVNTCLAETNTAVKCDYFQELCWDLQQTDWLTHSVSERPKGKIIRRAEIEEKKVGRKRFTVFEQWCSLPLFVVEQVLEQVTVDDRAFIGACVTLSHYPT